ncbi:sensor histidine kinase [Actinophytocola oryzae]|uniref:histidine kinase n=1 Tax=Actinophytocola oryzae TaxID=502181 RepID=A0A4R7V8Y6_9PSEU|nr:HAMP domain-containing sensor histidine kinase [Actinophytocola oryzae]TDV45368.1 two-component system sensor histidine kinase MprB [Actinophytocola oryzae]
MLLGAPFTSRKRASLRARVSLLAASCVAGAVALVSLGAYFTVRENLYTQLDDALWQKARSTVQNEWIGTTPTGEQFPIGLLALNDVQVAWVKSDGTLMFGDPRRLPPISSAELAVASGADDHIRTDQKTDTRVVAVSYQGGVLVLAQSWSQTKKQLGDLSLVLFLIGGAGVVVAAIAGTAVARTGLRPVQRLTMATERVARTGDLRPIQVEGDDELARLSHSFNLMLGAVAEAQNGQRQLVADAGHELRTPLTSLRTNLELLLAAEKPDTPQLSDVDKAEIHDDLRAQLDELTQLIGDLVELAREDAPTLTHEHMDMVEVVEQALARARRRAGEVSFEVDLQPWYLYGEPHTLERAVLNLLDNAVKFSPAGGTVRVELRAAAHGYAFLQVADAGPGIKDADLPHVFDRFYRSDEARTLPGSGLGLAIVKSAAERHGGAVFAGRSADGGALIAMRLPGSPEPIL